GRANALIFNMIRPFRANELRGVKSCVMCCVMCWMGWVFRETFIPAYCGLASTGRPLMSEGVRKNLRHLFRPCPDQTTRTGGRRTKDREKESMKRLSSFGLDVRRLSRLGLILLPVLVGLA